MEVLLHPANLTITLIMKHSLLISPPSRSKQEGQHDKPELSQASFQSVTHKCHLCHLLSLWVAALPSAKSCTLKPVWVQSCTRLSN